MKAAPSRSPFHARTGVLALLASLVLAACSATGSSSSPSAGQQSTLPSATGSSTVAATPSSAPASETQLATAVPIDIDPCQLITADEASKLAGVTFPAGQSHTGENNVNVCTYSTGTTSPNIFNVLVAQATDEATAKAAEQQGLDQLKTAAEGVKLTTTPLPNLASGVDTLQVEANETVSGIKISVIGIYMLKGKTFVGFSDIAVGASPPAASVMQTQATSVLGRIP